jgi:hypothetical protein
MKLISRSLAVAMENADTSSLNNNEIELIKNFPDFVVTNWNEESNDINGRCSISGLFDHCVEIELINAV